MQFSIVLGQAIHDGLAAAALVDRDGKAIGLAGAISEEEAMPLAALVMYGLKSDDLAARLLTGEVVSLALDERDVAVCIAKRQLFVVAVLSSATPAMLERVGQLRDDIAGMLQTNEPDVPLSWQGGSGSGSSGPAQLPLIEFGITVRRERGKA